MITSKYLNFNHHIYFYAYRAILFLLIIIFMLALNACRSGSPSNPVPVSESLPCWVKDPVHGDVIGSVGQVRADTKSYEEAVKWAKRKAAMMLSPYCQADKEAIANIDQLGIGEGNRTQFGKCQLGFVDQIRNGAYLYVYAVTGDTPKEQFLQKTDCNTSCAPSVCQPPWICQPMGDEQAGFLGVSARASSKSMQYRLAMTNALEQIAIIYGVTVDSEYLTAKGASDKQSRTMYYKDKNELMVPDKKDGKQEPSRPVVANSCFHNGKLYVRVLDYSLPALSNVPPEKWKSNPNLGDRLGVVGSAGPTASGRLSDQFRLAMKRGLVQLAKAKEIDVKGTTYVKHTESSRIVLDIQHQSSHTTVVGEVAGLYFQKESLGHRLFLWIRSPKAESTSAEQ